MVYENLDPNGQYTIRINGRGEMALNVNQKKAEPPHNQEMQSPRLKPTSPQQAREQDSLRSLQSFRFPRIAEGPKDRSRLGRSERSPNNGDAFWSLGHRSLVAEGT